MNILQIENVLKLERTEEEVEIMTCLNGMGKADEMSKRETQESLDGN